MFSSQSSPANPPPNPFDRNQPKNPFAATSSNNVFSQGSSGSQPAKANPFAPKPNPFATTGSQASPFGQQSQPAKPFRNPFAPTNGTPLKTVTQPASTGTTTTSTTGKTNKFQQNPFTKPANPPTDTKTPNGVAGAAVSHAQDWGQHKHGYVQPAWPGSKDSKSLATPKSTVAANGNTTKGKRKNDEGRRDAPKFPKSSTARKGDSYPSAPTSLQPSQARNPKTNHTSRPPKQPVANSNSRGDDVGAKIRAQLAKDGIKPPQWPTNPGSYSQRKAAENFRDLYSAYREKAMKSLIRAGLFDDPDTKRRLSEAINFKGICEDMCPDWDKITRIVQHDIKKEEKEEIDGELVASLPLMVTRYSRSSAGQDLPLPMDVRSPAALRRTLNYLISELIPDDDMLPIRHHFLWDRTRAIRREFTFQGAAMSAEEKKDYLYCLETITRFHITSLHLLSQPDFGHEGFSEQQEIEQLSKTLISLMEAYDDFTKSGIACENEAEFRGYYIVFNASDPALMEKVQSWEPSLQESDHIKTAICLAHALGNTWTETGPLLPKAATEMALSMAAMFFSIVADPKISYTMACFAEVHFGSARYSMLQTILNGYQRPKDGPKDLTPAFLRDRLHFETEEDAIAFVQLHHMKFRGDGDNKYLILPPSNQQRVVPKVRVPHSYSHNIVEWKRGDRALPDVIYETVWNEDDAQDEEESLFVDGSGDTYFDEDSNVEADSDVETVSTTATPPATLGIETPPSNDSATSLFKQPPPSSFGVQSGFSAQGVNIQDFGSPKPSEVPKTSEVPSSLFQKPLEGPFGQGTGVGKTPSSSSLFSTAGGEKPNEQPNLTPSAVLPKNPFAQEPNTSNAPSGSGSNGSIFNQSAPTSANQDATPSSIFSSVPPAAGTGFKFPTFSNVSNDSTKPAMSALASPPKSGVSKPKKHVSFEAMEPPILENEPLTTSEMQPAAPSLPSTTNSLFKPPFAPSQLLKEPPRDLGTPQSAPSLQSSTVAKEPSKEPLKPTQKSDPLDNFTRWYVFGDKGLMETQLEPTIVETMLRDVWDEYHQAEQERKRREEDEKSWAEARRYREYSLSVKYFYKWRDGSRRRRTVKRIQAEREKARQWRLPENVAKRKAAEKAAQEESIKEATNLMRMRSQRSAEESFRLSQSTQSESRRRSRQFSIENALLASGVLDGVHDPQEAARYAARAGKTDSEDGMLPGEQMLLRAQNQRRKKQGLQPLKQLPKPKTYKEGSKSAMLKALAGGSGRSSLSMSTNSFRNSTFSSSYRSSLGFNNSRVSKATSKVTDPYWRLKASGLVQMPNGEYLHESLAIPMLQEGKRFPGLGDYGLPREQSASPSQSLLSSRGGTPKLIGYSPTNSLRRSRLSNSPAASDVVQGRKRIRADEGEEEDAGGHNADDDDLASLYRSTVAGDRKRAKSGSGQHDAASVAATDDTDFLSSIDNLLLQVQEVNRASSSQA